MRRPFDDTTAPLPGSPPTPLGEEVARLARIIDPGAALLAGQEAIAHFGPAPALLRLTLAAGRSLLEAAVGATDPSGKQHRRQIAVYVDALLEAAMKLAKPPAPLFMQIVLALFARRRWGRAALVLEAAIASGQPAIPRTWADASLARARDEVRALRETSVPSTDCRDARRTP